MWRVGILYRAADMLRVLQGNPSTPSQVVGRFPRYEDVDTASLVSTLVDAGWASVGAEGRLSVSESGQRLLSLDSPVQRLRVQLGDLLRLLCPPWAAAAAQGRSALAKYLPREAVQCFRESGLLDGNTPEVVAWWDELALRYRHDKDAAKVDTGRRGERLTYEYELARTLSEPDWIALEYSDAGYDILSRVSSLDRRQLLIEAKASVLPWCDARFFLTRHEWETLASASHSEVHLWALGSPTRHAIISCSALLPHMPKDEGLGNWSLMGAPFSAFVPLVGHEAVSSSSAFA